MPSFMVSNQFLIFLAHRLRFPFKSESDTLNGIINLLHGNFVLFPSSSIDGSFVHHVLQRGPGESWCSPCNHFDVNIRPQGLSAAVNLENVNTTLEVWEFHIDPPIEATGSKKSLIQDIRPVCRSDHNDTIIAFEAVHFDQNLVERLLTLVIATGNACASLPPDSINFVDEDDARSVLLRLTEQISHTRCTHANEHFHKLGSRDGEERHSCFSGNSPRKESLSGSRGTFQDHTPRDLCSELAERIGLLQEANDFLELQLRSVTARNIRELDTSLRCELEFGLRPAHFHGVHPSGSWHPTTSALTAGEQENSTEEDCREDKRLQEGHCSVLLLLR
mmetsp:Transcript_29281/g.113541  ORF Transcript_29281/g.113541 Transcript_29281/m.113541 type:complete len:334 (-) Transcript_29281:802-1803(-)